MKKYYLISVILISSILMICGCGKSDSADSEVSENSAETIEEIVSTAEFGDMVVVERNDDYEDEGAVELSVPEENPADMIHLHDNNEEDSGDSGDTADTGSTQSQNTDGGNSVEEPNEDKCRSLTDVFYGYTESQILSSTVAQMINDKMGYSRNKQYSTSDLTFFVPFGTKSSEMSYFSDYMNKRTIESLRGTVENWDSLSESQRMALGGLVYSGLLPEDVFVYWGLDRDIIKSYAVSVASY